MVYRSRKPIAPQRNTQRRTNNCDFTHQQREANKEKHRGRIQEREANFVIAL